MPSALATISQKIRSLGINAFRLCRDGIHRQNSKPKLLPASSKKSKKGSSAKKTKKESSSKKKTTKKQKKAITNRAKTKKKT